MENVRERISTFYDLITNEKKNMKRSGLDLTYINLLTKGKENVQE